MRTAAAAMSLILGLGFGVPCAFGIRHFAQTKEIWTFLGFPAYGHGPFERFGIQTSIPLLVGFLVVCLAEVVVGVLIGTGARYAPILSYALLPFEFAFWIGFALPFGPPLGLARVALLFLT